MIQLGAEAQRVGGEAEVEAGGAAGQDLLPFGGGRVGRDAGDHADHDRGAQEAGALHLQAGGRRGLLLLGEAGLEQDAAEAGAGLALEDDEAPGLQLLVVGNAGGGGKDDAELLGRRAGLAQQGRLGRAALQQQVDGFLAHGDARGMLEGRMYQSTR